jgi:hypothetical protein
VTSPVPPTSPETPPAAGGVRRFTWRWLRRLLALVVAVVAAGLMSVFTIDLGPALKHTAEVYGTKYLNGRPLHIGRLSAKLTPGDFVLDNVVIEGRRSDDRPFFSAGRISVHVPWWTIFRHQIVVEVTLDDWHMVVERWADGHNVPKFGQPRTRPSGPRRFTTTVSFVHASHGSFVYDDHVTPWSVTAPNLGFDLVRSEALDTYIGRSTFSDGVVRIQDYKPMRTSMTTRFDLDGGLVHLRHIDLLTDGTRSHVTGEVNFANWPEQTYNVNSTVDFPTMHDIFFSRERWTLGGTGTFAGIFAIDKEGFNLSGDFRSEDAAVDTTHFTDLHGSLSWTPTRFVVPHADANALGGTTRLVYELAPLGTPRPATAIFSADYAGLDLADLDRFIDLKGLRLGARASGHLSLTWPNGHFAAGREGEGHTRLSAPAGTELAAAELPSVPRAIQPEPQPFDPNRAIGVLPVGGDIDYQIDTGGWTFRDSWVATAYTYIRFSGRMASEGPSRFPFHVTSHDWQESDRLRAAVMTAITGASSSVEVGGRGTFDGAMTGQFHAPTIAGHVTSQATHVWGVTWGAADADVIIHDGYVDISHGRFGDGPDALITADGRFALGFRQDAAEEINARVSLVDWPMADLRHAFGLDDWPVDGIVAQTDLTLRGKYRQMFGAGQLRVERGTAWGEHFDRATGSLDLDGTGLRVHGLVITKGPGTVRGDVRVGWDGTYAFNADGEAIAVESLDNFKIERAPLSGRLRFTASGASELDQPRYRFSGAIDDLFVGDQGIGQVQGDVRIENRTLWIERLIAVSSLLDIDGRGSIGLDKPSMADLHWRFTQSSIDPYLKFFAPQVSPYTRAIASGTLDVSGPLSDPAKLAIDARINDATLTLLNYDLVNDGPITLGFHDDAFRVGQLRLKGSDTNLQLSGSADAATRTWHLSAGGDASLAILQLFFPGITSSGAATLNAQLGGSFDAPRLSGEATVMNGRLRPIASPHSLEAINGRIRFGDRGINLDGLRGRIGSGDVDFGGTIALEGYLLSQYNVTARGRSMRLRYPEGFNSTVNMDLLLSGPLRAPRLTGTVDVLNVTYTGRAQSDAALFGLAGVGGFGSPTLAPTPIASSAIPLVLDIQVTAPRMPLIQNKVARIEGTADLRVHGTFDRPSITGAIDILNGEVTFNGNRYFVRESSIEFTNPSRVEPIFDVTADTRPRIAGQTFDVNIHIAGPLDHLVPQITSDPPLPETDIVSLLLGGTPDVGAPEQRALRSPQEAQQELLQSVGAVLLTSPISSAVGQVVERTLPIDTVQITPLLTNDTAFQQLNPSARVTLGKRISPRVYLTYSRTLNSPEEEILLLEYDQNDRVSWVLSRQEDHSFALDFRIRYVF